MHSFWATRSTARTWQGFPKSHCCSAHITFRYPCFSSHFCILAIKQIWWRNKYLKCRSYVIMIFIWSRISIMNMANMLCKNKENPNIRWHIYFDDLFSWLLITSIMNSFLYDQSIFFVILTSFNSIFERPMIYYQRKPHPV